MNNPNDFSPQNPSAPNNASIEATGKAIEKVGEGFTNIVNNAGTKMNAIDSVQAIDNNYVGKARMDMTSISNAVVDAAKAAVAESDAAQGARFVSDKAALIGLDAKSVFSGAGQAVIAKSIAKGSKVSQGDAAFRKALVAEGYQFTGKDTKAVLKNNLSIVNKKLESYGINTDFLTKGDGKKITSQFYNDMFNMSALSKDDQNMVKGLMEERNFLLDKQKKLGLNEKAEAGNVGKAWVKEAIGDSDAYAGYKTSKTIVKSATISAKATYLAGRSVLAAGVGVAGVAGKAVGKVTQVAGNLMFKVGSKVGYVPLANLGRGASYLGGGLGKVGSKVSHAEKGLFTGKAEDAAKRGAKYVASRIGNAVATVAKAPFIIGINAFKTSTIGLTLQAARAKMTAMLKFIANSKLGVAGKFLGKAGSRVFRVVAAPFKALHSLFGRISNFFKEIMWVIVKSSFILLGVLLVVFLVGELMLTVFTLIPGTSNSDDGDVTNSAMEKAIEKTWEKTLCGQINDVFQFDFNPTSGLYKGSALHTYAIMSPRTEEYYAPEKWTIAGVPEEWQEMLVNEEYEICANADLNYHPGSANDCPYCMPVTNKAAPVFGSEGFFNVREGYTFYYYWGPEDCEYTDTEMGYIELEIIHSDAPGYVVTSKEKVPLRITSTVKGTAGMWGDIGTYFYTVDPRSILDFNSGTGRYLHVLDEDKPKYACTDNIDPITNPYAWLDEKQVGEQDEPANGYPDYSCINEDFKIELIYNGATHTYNPNNPDVSELYALADDITGDKTLIRKYSLSSLYKAILSIANGFVESNPHESVSFYTEYCEQFTKNLIENATISLEVGDAEIDPYGREVEWSIMTSKGEFTAYTDDGKLHAASYVRPVTLKIEFNKLGFAELLQQDECDADSDLTKKCDNYYDHGEKKFEEWEGWFDDPEPAKYSLASLHFSLEETIFTETLLGVKYPGGWFAAPFSEDDFPTEPYAKHITSDYGLRKRPFGVDPEEHQIEMHHGYDVSWGGILGTEIYSGCTGTVKTVSYDAARGRYMTLEDEDTGYTITYEHLKEQLLSTGDPVIRGVTIIGTVGGDKADPMSGDSTGAHVHIEIKDKHGKYVNPEHYMVR